MAGMDIAFAILLSAIAMSVIVGVRYLATSGGFAWLTGRVRPGLYVTLRPQIGREIRWSLLSALIYGVPAGIIGWGWQNRGWTRIYENASDYPLWYLPVSFLIYLVLHDTWFYWTHRWMHTPKWFRIAHAVHHDSRPPTAWAAMSFHPVEAVTGAVIIPLLVFMVPVHSAVLAAILFVMTFMGVTNHMGWEIFPRFVVQGALGKAMITASHHQRHHAQYRCNYGLYFRFWDRLCGTDSGIGGFPARGRAAPVHGDGGRGLET